jgi:hypothetical protein
VRGTLLCFINFYSGFDKYCLARSIQIGVYEYLQACAPNGFKKMVCLIFIYLTGYNFRILIGFIKME